MKHNSKRQTTLETRNDDLVYRSFYMAAAIGLGVFLILLIVLSVIDAQEEEAEISYGDNQMKMVVTIEPSPPVYRDTPLESIKYEDILVQEQEEMELTKVIEKVIYVEARGECLEGKIAVGASVMNRLASPEFPDDIEQVLKAYASIQRITEEMLKKVPECREAAERAVEGEDPIEEILGGPTFYFYNPDIADPEEVEKRKDLKVTYRIGNHVFYSKWE